MKNNIILYLCLLGYFIQNAAMNGVVYAFSLYLFVALFLVAGFFVHEFVSKHSGRN